MSTIKLKKDEIEALKSIRIVLREITVEQNEFIELLNNRIGSVNLCIQVLEKIFSDILISEEKTSLSSKINDLASDINELQKIDDDYIERKKIQDEDYIKEIDKIHIQIEQSNKEKNAIEKLIIDSTNNQHFLINKLEEIAQGDPELENIVAQLKQRFGNYNDPQ